jgi:hypothetical protein
MQEWNNKWLTGMVKGRGGGEYDHKYYRKTIAPNVLHFLKIKEDIESAFELKRRSKAHTSPHLRDETHVLLRMYRDEELHLFRPGRGMGHAAVNRFDRGNQRLEGGKMAEFLERSAEYAAVLATTEKVRALGNDSGMDLDPPTSPSPPKTPPPERGAPSPPQTPVSERPGSSNSTHSSHSSSSITSLRSSTSTSSRAATDSVHSWDDVDHSDERLTSGSDLTVTIDETTGLMSTDWYGEEEFEDVLIRLCGAEDELETSDEEDEPQPQDDVASDSDDDNDDVD